MRATASTWWVPRAGSDAAQFEDAFAPQDGTRHARRLRFAVADGAGESMLSGLWADLLVRTWCKARRRRLPQVLESAAAAWEVELAAYLEHRERSDRPVQWFEEPGLERGAFATLLGLAFTTDGASTTRGEWRAVSLGDTCLFQVRDGELLSAFPLKSSDQFDCAPKLVPSRPDDMDRVTANIDEEAGDWRVGDTFFLMTDAVAAWFLRVRETGGAPWDELGGIADADAFTGWVHERRRSRALRNDDVTVMRVDIGDR